MCGRFTLILEPEAIQKELNLGDLPPDFRPRFNIAPSQPVAVVTDPETRNVEMFRWGLIPSWAKDPAIGNRMINARSETLVEKPSFRTAFTRRRCLILADGFYEWYRPEKESPSQAKARPIPYYFHLESGKPFAFAGLWEMWRPPEGSPEAVEYGGKVLSCTMITCPANEHVARFHERMPVILDEERLWSWLEKDAPVPFLQNHLLPYPAEKMISHPVSPAVNNPGNDTQRCIEPLITGES